MFCLRMIKFSVKFIILIYLNIEFLAASEDYETSGYVVGESTGVSGTLENAKSLLTNILSNYDTRLRPRLNQSKSVVVVANFIPNAIVNFDVTGQKIDVIGFFRVKWSDEVMTWNASSFGDTKAMMVPLKNIWYPKLVIDKAYVTNGIIGERGSDIVKVDDNGQVRWVPNGLYSFICEADVTFFPYDIQSCAMQFYASDQRASAVELITSMDVNLENFTENAEWRLLKVVPSISLSYGTNIVSVTFHLERRPSFTMYTIVLPLCTLSALSMCTFLVPVECGEKGSLSITIFLSYGFFIAITRDSLPHNSVNIPYFVSYVCALLVLSVLTVVYVMIETKIYYSIGTKPCNVQLSRLRSLLPKPSRIGGLLQSAGKQKAVVSENEMKTREKSSRRVNINKDSASHVRLNVTNKDDITDGRENNNQFTWADFLSKMNIVMFCSSLVFSILFSVAVWVKIVNR